MRPFRISTGGQNPLLRRRMWAQRQAQLQAQRQPERREERPQASTSASAANSNWSDEDAVSEYTCRKCPGKRFTTDEMDAHRSYHRRQKEFEALARRRRQQNPVPSPAGSDVTLFTEVSSPDEQQQTGRRKRPAESTAPGPASKRRSKKHYDDTLVGSWHEDVNGG